MLVLAVLAGDAGSEYETAVVHAGVVSSELFFGDEVYCRIVICEIVRHLLDGLLDKGSVSTFFCNYETLSCVLLSCCKFGLLTGSYGIESSVYGDRVLLAVLYAGDAADGIGVACETPLPQKV